MMYYREEESKLLKKLGYEPDKIVKYYVYSKGKLELETYDYSEAKIAKEELNGVVEKIIANEDEIREYTENRKILISELNTRWSNELREEHSKFNDEEYDLIYKMAYADGHSYGYDEVAIYMIKYAEFASELLKTKGE